ncbi:hypothetical protein TraAM80_06689 [Trypanosoma rangeli]|uniref:Ribosomal protein L30 ferredoxin-like fold domain-containing protein n=1 Tax=Trypanosoma rangeli TaxID=5698 RepID=A0A422N907_TRYRA|nr:uncharacterized protein TraAM80_06689 [Trypanosoma rangeli]RNF01969.1 hypothetical protein TraAM80_06689 [Trypanosoma rangeli]|eukprot:RNF01969.1 hypothetical protein TraAM80_06689 [Trypanosoma rangeli]
MWRAWTPVQLSQRRAMCYATPFLRSKPTSSIACNDLRDGGGEVKQSHTNTSIKESTTVASTSIAPGPYRHVGNIFIVQCDDHPFKHSWEINRMLRELRLEYKGQTTILPDIPPVRKQLWRVRHVVKVDMLDLDEAKTLIGVPEHVSFSDLASQIPATFGRVRAVANPVLRSKMNFMKLRRMRLRDVLHRDALELRLLEERRKAARAAQQNEEQQPASPIEQTRNGEASQSS